MVFNETVFLAVIFIVLVWQGVITFVVYRMIGHYHRLAGDTGKNTLREILEHILLTQKDCQRESRELSKKLGALETDTGFHIQRIGLVRFNPFSDTGGSQSFTLALLDGHTNGIVMTSLFARTGNRWYVKEVRDGKGMGIELSKEEAKAISNARHIEAGKPEKV